MRTLPTSIHASELNDYQHREDTILLDIRSAESFKKYHLPDSVSLPLEQLSHELNYLDDEKHYIIICEFGQKAQGVANILGEQDFSAAVLTDGLTSFKNQ